ncbi:hypothetical protein IJJ05_01905 [Candidatus Saccharibacteria bacterium]|nr:hypothetical protein [Candidatus Saccharibacteria bacterium]
MEPNLETISTEIVETSTEAPTVAPEKPKKSKGLIATIVILSILAVAAIAAAVYFYLDASNKVAANSELQAKLDLLKTETGAELIETTENGTTTVNTPELERSKVKKIVQQVYQSVSSNISDGRFETVYSDSSMIKIPDSTVYTSSNESYGVTSWGFYTYSNAGDDIMANAHIYAETVLADNGFIEDKELMSSKLFHNSDNGIYCDVSENSLPFSMSCSKDTWISDENKNLALALAKAANVFFVSADTSNITDSTISPYQRLTAGGPGAVLLFYRVSPDADWQFFTGTQDSIPCSNYTGDVAKAFAGDICYDESTSENSTVQP